MRNKFILDACCAGRMFWFDKQHPNSLYVDIRTEEKGHIQNHWNPNHEVKPDEIADFRNLPYKDGSFRLVIFDPPHIIRDSFSVGSVMHKKFGTLLRETWKDDLTKGFSECWRVLSDYGILVFKWGENDVSVSEVLSLFSVRPLIGHPSGSKNQNHWMLFMKIPSNQLDSATPHETHP